ncbi:MAG: mobile mystery protein B [Candidatus Margulisbacteria bacterium]|nr:mobile mystery protein B [Candidatus Margulisiibacteriota bacterium]MBU1021597.1 mobile mystery protein B [Candidatus Margulisiibacteriota bacterium]MBU1728748.1 mobile mystery protein B [Candidatus Margulisiibacteriota bacterium]MBU1955714.1 mobile mystery protein B [Candidatus Margulisiibacteriota bacterium]
MPLIENVPGATPVDDISGLIPTHITTHSELNEWEAANILKAAKKYLTVKRYAPISINWLKKVHKDMFDETWSWAGKLRQSNFNLGIDWHSLQEQMKMLVDDITHFAKMDNAPGIFEQSVRIHHRLVKIHPFINGNGRHARLVADIYLFSHGHKLPIWPDKALIQESDARKRYISALQAADKGNYNPLEVFTAELIGPG